MKVRHGHGDGLVAIDLFHDLPIEIFYLRCSYCLPELDQAHYYLDALILR